MKSDLRVSDTVVNFEARLNIRDGKVLCPHSGGYRSIEDCAECSELLQIDPDAVICQPPVDRQLSAVIDDIVRASPDTGGK